MRFLGVFILLFLACDSSNKEHNATADSPKKYDLYEPSEMAVYMNSIYDLHEQLKNDILDGNPPKGFPEEILNIHSAQLSDFKERTPNFEAFSHLFVENVKFIFEENTDVPLKKRYNDAIDVCLSCHQTECTGPIPRIKKLIIQ